MVGFEQYSPPHGFQMYGGAEGLFHSSNAPAAAAAAAAATTTTTLGSDDTQHHTQVLWYHLEVLKEKVHSLVNLLLVSPSPMQAPHSESLTMVASAPNLIQEIIAAAFSMLHSSQQLANSGGAHLPTIPVPDSNSFMRPPPPTQPSNAHEVFDHVLRELDDGDEMKRGDGEVLGAEPTLYGSSSSNGSGAGANGGGDEIIDVDASDLLAKYTHHCQVCGKGFKRDANLRMHMRAHGDEYKTNAALASPSMGLRGVAAPAGRINIKYSCPHEGCRWNRKHAKFQPLKSMVCVKNHYKRSHCPKMYVCNRCRCKQFAVLSDLRTHEKHCGNLKWMCSCGTNFTRKDKLMGHVALFVGHAPAVNRLTK